MPESLTNEEMLALFYHGGHKGWDATWVSTLETAARKAHASLVQRGLIETFKFGQHHGVGLTAAGREVFQNLDGYSRLLAKGWRL